MISQYWYFQVKFDVFFFLLLLLNWRREKTEERRERWFERDEVFRVYINREVNGGSQMSGHVLNY